MASKLQNKQNMLVPDETEESTIFHPAKNNNNNAPVDQMAF